MTKTITVSMPMEKYDEVIKEARDAGGTKGQRHMVYMLNQFSLENLPREAIQQGGIDDETWKVLQGLLDRLAAK